MEMYGHRDIRSRVFLHVLDILNQESIENLKHRLLSDYGGNYNCFIIIVDHLLLYIGQQNFLSILMLHTTFQD